MSSTPKSSTRCISSTSLTVHTHILILRLWAVLTKRCVTTKVSLSPSESAHHRRLVVQHQPIIAPTATESKNKSAPSTNPTHNRTPPTIAFEQSGVQGSGVRSTSYPQPLSLLPLAPGHITLALDPPPGRWLRAWVQRGPSTTLKTGFFIWRQTQNPAEASTPSRCAGASMPTTKPLKPPSRGRLERKASALARFLRLTRPRDGG